MSGKYWLNWQQASTSWFRITDHALRFLCFHSEFWIAFCCRKPLNHLAHTELQATQASAWVRNALTLIQDRYGSCRLPLFFSMPKLILHAVLAQEVTDKQCLHVAQSSLTRGHGQWLAPLSDPAQTSSRYWGVGGDGDDHYKTICQEGCNALFDRAVDSPACRLPVDTCSSTRPVQSHQPQKCPQPTKQRVKQATGWSCRWRAQLGNRRTHTQKRKNHAGEWVGEVCLPPTRRSMSVSGNQMKPGIAFACHGPICIDSLFSSNWVPTGETKVFPRSTSPEVRMSPCPKYAAGWTRSNVWILSMFTCCMYWGLQGRPGSERVNLRSFGWSQRGKKAAFINRDAKRYNRHWSINVSSMVQRDPWGERISIKNYSNLDQRVFQIPRWPFRY